MLKFSSIITLSLSVIFINGCVETTWVKDGVSAQSSSSIFEKEKAQCLQEAYKTIPTPQYSNAMNSYPVQPQGYDLYDNYNRRIGSIQPNSGYGGNMYSGYMTGEMAARAEQNNPSVQYNNALATYQRSCMISKGWRQVEIKK